jgi:hypothetical protein
MYSNYSYMSNGSQFVNLPYPFIPYVQQPYYNYNSSHSVYPYYSYIGRQQSVRGQATWTEGGPVTQCGLSWSDNEYMTAAVGENTPYQCGQTIKIRNLSSPGPREILVTVVDKVEGYPPNRINLHRKAFEALGANPAVGVINIEITPSPELEQEKWGKYLLEVTQTAYPDYNITEYNFIRKTQVLPTQTKETYQFILESPQERIKVQGNVIYNPNTDRVISFDLEEV